MGVAWGRKGLKAARRRTPKSILLLRPWEDLRAVVFVVTD